MTIAAITGGRDYHPALVELERLAERLEARGVTKGGRLRHGDARGADRLVSGWLSARGIVEVEAWPADWASEPTLAGRIRNAAMLEGRHRTGPRPPVDVLFAFEGGRGTSHCTATQLAAGRPVEWMIAEGRELEPRIANRHASKPPPGPWVYVGRGRPRLWHEGEADTPWRRRANPLGNPFKLDPGRPRADQAAEILGKYRAWLWARMRERSPQLAMLHHLRPEHYLVCSCWPRRCHAEVIVQAWRWMRDSGRLEYPRPPAVLRA